MIRLLIVLIVTTVTFTLVSNLMAAIHRGKQKRTMADIRSIGSSAEAFAVDNGGYPCVMMIEDLVPLVEPTYIKKLPTLDGWGHPFQLVAWDVDPETGWCAEYVIASSGGDELFTHADPRANPGGLLEE